MLFPQKVIIHRTVKILWQQLNVDSVVLESVTELLLQKFVLFLSLHIFIFSIICLWKLLWFHCAFLHEIGSISLEAVRSSVPKDFRVCSSCNSSKWLPILMCRIRETENLWSFCTATLPRASSIHTFMMALLVGFLRTTTLFLLHKEFEMWGSPSVHNKVSYSEISKPFVNWNDLSLVSSCPSAMGVAGCSKFTYMATFCKKAMRGQTFSKRSLT